MDLQDILSQYQTMTEDIKSSYSDKLSALEKIENKISEIESDIIHSPRWKTDQINKLRSKIEQKRQKVYDWLEEQQNTVLRWLNEKKEEINKKQAADLKRELESINNFEKK